MSSLVPGVAHSPRCAGATDRLASIAMPTTVHLPRALLDALDRKAKALRINRSQLVVRALEHELSGSSDWSPGFFERLSERVPNTADAADEVEREDWAGPEAPR